MVFAQLTLRSVGTEWRASGHPHQLSASFQMMVSAWMNNGAVKKFVAHYAAMSAPDVCSPATLILGACCCSTASAASIPDPTLPGPDTVTKVEYYGGSVMMSAPNANGSATAAFQHPLDGALFYPNGPGPFDVVILIHGNHADCLTATGSETTPSQSNCATAAPGNVPLLNYEGYDYLADNLASHGFIVLSLDADMTNAGQDNATTSLA